MSYSWIAQDNCCYYLFLIQIFFVTVEVHVQQNWEVLLSKDAILSGCLLVKLLYVRLKSVFLTIKLHVMYLKISYICLELRWYSVHLPS